MKNGFIKGFLRGVAHGRFSSKRPNPGNTPKRNPLAEVLNRLPHQCSKCHVQTRTLKRLINHHRNEHEMIECRIRRTMRDPVLQHEHLEKLGLA